MNAEVKKENVTHLFVIIPNILPDKKKYISQNFGELNLVVRFLPDFKDFLSNQITLSEIKQLNIEDLGLLNTPTTSLPRIGGAFTGINF